MNLIRCNSCNSMKPESEILCIKCGISAKIQLAEIVKLLEEAENFLQPTKGNNANSSSERTIGINVAALNFVAGHDVLGVLLEWQDLIREELALAPRLNLRGLVIDRVKNAVEFIQVHWYWFSAQESFFPDFVVEIKTLHSTGLRVTGQTPLKIRQIPCPSDLEIDGKIRQCGKNLNLDGSDLELQIECKRCATRWTGSWLIMVADKKNVWLDAESIGFYKQLSPNHVRKISKKFGVAKKNSDYNLGQFIAAYEKSTIKGAK